MKISDFSGRVAERLALWLVVISLCAYVEVRQRQLVAVLDVGERAALAAERLLSKLDQRPPRAYRQALLARRRFRVRPVMQRRDIVVSSTPKAPDPPPPPPLPRAEWVVVILLAGWFLSILFVRTTIREQERRS